MPPATVGDPPDALAEGETTPADGIDTINGGDGDGDTVSYEGEAATFDDQGNEVAVSALEIDLAGTVVPAVEDDPDTGADESVPAHRTATLGSVADRIVVENKGSKEEPNWVSTIENVVGGGGDDDITGDARSNELTGGPGEDTIAGGKGSDTVNADNADIDLDGGTGLLAEDNEATVDVDESTAGDMDVLSYAGVKEDTDDTNNVDAPTPDGVSKTIVDDDQTSGIRGFEMVMGSPLNDTLTAPAEGGVTIMGGGGADELNGAAGDDTLKGGAGVDDIDGEGGADELNGAAGDDTLKGGAGVDDIDGEGGADELNGGPGEDMLTGGPGGDVFVLSAGEGPDTIDDYMPDEADEKVRLENFPSGSTPVVVLSDTSTAVIMVGKDILFKFTAHGAGTLDAIVLDLKKTGSIVFVQPN
jgi:Ca2+-binding RTX toxin-like protein